MSDRLLVSTRKGLFTLARTAAGWGVSGVSFLGENVTLARADPRDGGWYAALNLGHFGVKLKYSPDGGKTWEDRAAPAYPDGETVPTGDGKSTDAAKLKLIWALEFGAATQPGGLLASGSNLNETKHDMFGVIPEVTITGRVDITPHIRATIGYNFLWVNNVVRAGDQVNLNVDPTTFHGASAGSAPVARLVDDSYYLHGVTAGIEARY